MKVFSTTDTGLSYYNDMMRDPVYFLRDKGMEAKVVRMSPNQYLVKSAEIRGVSLQHELRIVNKADVEKYSIMMSHGIVFDLPVLDYVGRDQEGRHRVLAAKKLGIKSIPVFVVKKASKAKIKKAVDAYMKKMYPSLKTS